MPGLVKKQVKDADWHVFSRVKRAKPEWTDYRKWTPLPTFTTHKKGRNSVIVGSGHRVKKRLFCLQHGRNQTGLVYQEAGPSRESRRTVKSWSWERRERLPADRSMEGLSSETAAPAGASEAPCVQWEQQELYSVSCTVSLGDEQGESGTVLSGRGDHEPESCSLMIAGHCSQFAG